tara:strand:+ start:1811 stop:2260 length:450 start_codon:yes stop_codon:yes gene_type:complete
MSTDQDVIPSDPLEAVVKWYDNKLKYGFVTLLDSKEDIFVHYNSIVCHSKTVYKTLFAGEYITTTLIDSDKGKQCFEVKGIREGLLLCESNKVLSKIQMLANMNHNDNWSQQRSDKKKRGQYSMSSNDPPPSSVISDNIYDVITEGIGA